MWNGFFTTHGLKLSLEETEASAAHGPPEGRDGHRAGGEETDSFVYIGTVCRDGKTERGVRRRVLAGANACGAVEGVMTDLKKTKGQGQENLIVKPACNVRNGNFGTDRTTTTKAASVREQLGTKNSKSREGRQEKNGGVMGRDESADELARENAWLGADYSGQDT